MLTLFFWLLVVIFFIIVVKLYRKNTGLLKKFYRNYPEYEKADIISFQEQYIFILSKEKLAFLGFDPVLDVSSAAKNPILASVDKIFDLEVIRDGESSKTLQGIKVGNLLFPDKKELMTFIQDNSGDSVSELKINMIIGDKEISFKLIDHELKKNSEVFVNRVKICAEVMRKFRELSK